MNNRLWSTAGMVLALAAPALSQEPTRSAADVITAIGCVQQESDYRAQIADSKGGVANTGVGVANEFVLRSARTVSSRDFKPIATTERGYEVVYNLTGKLEHEVAALKGQRIAVSGYVEVADSEGTKKVKDLPRLNIVGWHKVADRCDTPTPRK